MAQDFRGQSGLPLGLRNNNPLNIRAITGGWQGQVGSDNGFATFNDVAWGIRAFVSNFNTSVNKRGTDTLSEYINRYAPPSQNNTAVYLAKVAADTGVAINAPIPQTDDFIRKLVRSQMTMEIGAKYADMVSDADISAGISLARSGAASLLQSMPIYAKSHAGYILFFTGVASAVVLFIGIYRKPK